MVFMSDDKDRSIGADDWAGPEGELGDYIAKESKNTLRAYEHQPNLVDEHANHEEDTARGGYAYRQLFELVQNSADALAGTSDGGRIALRVTEDCLYCADDGDPIDQLGVRALMFSHLSPKRGTDEIGRFGLGFKSVLGVTDAPEFFSRSGSFRFDLHHSRERIQQVVPERRALPRHCACPTPSISPRVGIRTTFFVNSCVGRRTSCDCRSSLKRMTTSSGRCATSRRSSFYSSSMSAD